MESGRRSVFQDRNLLKKRGFYGLGNSEKRGKKVVQEKHVF